MVKRLIDQNPRREVRRQGLLLDRLEVSFRNRIRAEIARAMREMVMMFEATGEMHAPRDHVENLTSIYRAMAISTVATFGARVAQQGKAAWMGLERKDFAETMTRLALQYVADEAMRRRITSVAETTRSQIVSAVARGYADGLGQAGVARYISDLIPEFTQARSALIARTETHGAANYGSNEAARETGLRLRREWISADDDRTRADHADANGTIVGMDEAFDIGGSSLMYPGDPSGPPEQTINCRCVVGFVVDD